MVVAGDIIRIRAPLPIPEPDHINCYVIDAGDRRLLVDTGMHGSGDVIDAALRRFDVALDGVLITHGHPDHWGLARRYAEVVLAHADVRPQLAFHDRDPGSLSTHGLPPGRTVGAEMFELLVDYTRFTDVPPAVEEIADGQRLGEWEVVITPGHAPGHVCLYRARDRVLIAGDHLLPDITPNIHLTDEMPDAVGDYLASLRRVADMDIELVLPSHGEPFGNGPRRASELIAHHERRLARLEGMLRSEGPALTAELSRRLFNGSIDEPVDRLLAEMETYAHLEYLRRRGRVALDAAHTWTAAA